MPTRATSIRSTVADALGFAHAVPAAAMRTCSCAEGTRGDDVVLMEDTQYSYPTSGSAMYLFLYSSSRAA